MAAGDAHGSAPRRVGIAGLGLIGGSIALGLRRAWPETMLVGADQPDVVRDARRRGVIDEARATAADLIDVDVLVLATPVGQILQDLTALGAVPPSCAVTDVGSTKRHVHAAAAAAGLAAFVGGHPLAGRERRGLDAADAALFVGRPWFITTAPSTAPAQVARVEQLVRALGAVPTAIDPVTHDRTMAYVSHVPQLLAVGLMTAATEAVGRDAIRLGGRAFDEMTRLAASPAGIWESILATNHDYVAEALRALQAALVHAAASPSAVRESFETANRRRAELDAVRDTARG